MAEFGNSGNLSEGNSPTMRRLVTMRLTLAGNRWHPHRHEQAEDRRGQVSPLGMSTIVAIANYAHSLGTSM